MVSSINLNKDNIENFFLTLEKNPNTIELDLKVSLTNLRRNELFGHLAKLKNLKIISFTFLDTGLNGVTVQHFLNFLQETSVKKLYLGHQSIKIIKNNIGIQIQEAIGRRLDSLEELFIENIQIWSPTKHKFNSEFAKTLARSRITDLSLFANNLNDSNAPIIFKQFEEFLTLRKLDVGKNKMEEEGAKALARLIRLPDLEELKCEDNLFGDAGTRHIADALEKNISLKTLNLNNNIISPAGLHYLFEALKNTHLTRLDIKSNKINKEVGNNLIQLLKTNKLLAHIVYDKEKLSKEQNDVISLLIEFNNNLPTLDICDQTVAITQLIGEKEFIEMLERNSSVIKLKYPDNFFSTVGKKQVEEIVNRNIAYANKLYDAVKKKDSTQAKELLANGVSRISEIIYARVESTDKGLKEFHDELNCLLETKNAKRKNPFMINSLLADANTAPLPKKQRADEPQKRNQLTSFLS